MTTAKAITELRNKLGHTQPQFAEALHIAVVTISRYENGREPTPRMLKRLAELARSQDLDYLADIFETKRRGDIISKVDNLPSHGTARRVPLQDLSLWAGWQADLIAVLSMMSKGLKDGVLAPDSEDLQKVFESARGLAAKTHYDIQNYINPPKRLVWSELSHEAQAAISTHPSPEQIAKSVSEINKRSAEFWKRNIDQREGENES